MTKKLVSIFLTVITLLTGVIGMVNVSAAGTAANKFNVVFVLDASGSMNQSDMNGLRYDALNLFLGLLTEKGNHVGDVIFTQTVDRQLPISEIQTLDDKKKVLDDLKTIIPGAGDTNIGLGLAAATDMLDTQRNTALDSVIILLSDGNTDLKEQSAMEESEYYKEYAIGHARAGKYRIYCVGLNTNGQMNGSELQYIADQTGGEFVEVSDPADLSKVTETFYNVIYDTPSSTEKVVIGQNGTVEKKFNVPDIGIEEVNILVRGQTSGIQLVKPDASVIPSSDVDQLSLKTNEYTNVKITAPQKGEWSAVISGTPGAEVTISMISNVDLAVRAETPNQKDVYQRGETVKINGTIVSNGSDVTDEGIYNANKAVLRWKNNSTGVEETIDMRVENGKYTADVPITELATYEAVIDLTAGDISKSSDVLTFNVENSPPQVLQSTVEDKIVLWPFKDSSKTYDLSQYVKDDTDTVLKYELQDSSFKDGDVALDNGMLTVSPSVGVDGAITVNAIDSAGASSPLMFDIQVVSVTKLAVIIIAIIALIVLAILAFLGIRIARMRYRGKLIIQVFDKGSGMMYNRQTHEPYRGRQPIARLDPMARDVGLDGAFRPKDSRYIIYESKRPFFCTASPDQTAPLNKVEIALGMSVTISDTEDYMTGANITYV